MRVILVSLTCFEGTLDTSSQPAQAVKQFRICMPHGRMYGHAVNESLRLIVLADGKGADARKMGVGQLCLFGPGVERGLHLSEVALRLRFLRDVDVGVALAAHHILYCVKIDL